MMSPSTSYPYHAATSHASSGAMLDRIASPSAPVPKRYVGTTRAPPQHAACKGSTHQPAAAAASSAQRTSVFHHKVGGGGSIAAPPLSRPPAAPQRSSTSSATAARMPAEIHTGEHDDANGSPPRTKEGPAQRHPSATEPLTATPPPSGPRASVVMSVSPQTPSQQQSPMSVDRRAQSQGSTPASAARPPSSALSPVGTAPAAATSPSRVASSPSLKEDRGSSPLLPTSHHHSPAAYGVAVRHSPAGTSSLSSQISALQAQNEVYVAELHAASKKNLELELDVAKSQTTLVDLEEENTALRRDLANLRKSYTQLELSLSAKEAAHEQQLRQEREELVSTLQTDVASHWEGIRRRWQDREAQLKERIRELEARLDECDPESPGATTSSTP